MRTERSASGRGALRAGAWSIASRVMAKTIDLCMLLCLARFVGPADFGLVAIAMAVVFVVEALFELPVAAVLIRVDALTPSLLHTAFTLNLLRGLLIATLLAVASMPLAAFCDEPRLVSLLSVLSIAPALRGMTSPRLVEYHRTFDARPDVVIELGSKATAFVVAIAVAATTRSYWAIAAATVVGPLAGALLSYAVAPLRPRLTLGSWRAFSDMIGWNFVAQTFGALSWQVDRLMLPRVSTTTSFGHYALSKQIAEIPVQVLITPLHRPAMSMLSQVTIDRESAYIRLSRAATLILMPVSGVLVIWPEAVLTIAMGERWLPAADWLRWSSAILMLGIPALFLAPLALAMNETKKTAFKNCIELAIKIPLVATGAAWSGIPGALVGNAIATSIGTFVAMLVVRDMIGAGFLKQLGVFSGPSLAMIPGILVLGAARNLGADGSTASAMWMVFLPCVTMYFALYLGVVYATWRLAGRPAGPERPLFLKLEAVLQVFGRKLTRTAS